MTDRIIDISEAGARLTLKDEQLVIDRGEAGQPTVPLEDVAAVVVSHQQVSFSQPLLARMAELGVMLVVCDGRHMPVGMMAPIAGHSNVVERVHLQASAGLPLRKRLWQGLVTAKIAGQGQLLKRLHGDDGGLLAMAGHVHSGDPENLEAQAARRYWAALFGDPEFRRAREGAPPNGMLNYGYTVMRATVCRAICGAGLYPAFGLHHHNQYDSFCLADDLMEPLRPLVDRAVVEAVGIYGKDGELIPPVKRLLLEALTGRVEMENEQRTLFDACARMTRSLVQVLEGKRKDLIIPEIFSGEATGD